MGDFIEELHAREGELQRQAQTNGAEGLITIRGQKVRLSELPPYAQDVLDVVAFEPISKKEG
jgi:hypothetical protein